MGDHIPTDEYVRCVNAATKFYTVGDLYRVYKLAGNKYVRGNDGYFDDVTKMRSQFVSVNPAKLPSFLHG